MITDEVRPFLEICGSGERGLFSVAEGLARGRLRGEKVPELAELSARLRAQGEPHVWPRAWVASHPSGDRVALLESFRAFRLGLRGEGEARCGISVERTPGGAMVVAVVAIDALADLAPLKTRARAGEWLTVEAKLLVPIQGAKIVITGPNGAPRSVPSGLSGRTLRGRFAPDAPGAFTVQVLADTVRGPRPVVEARVFAEIEPTARINASVPGEGAAQGAQGAEALFRMIQSLREERGLPRLRRDPRLDAVALRQAEAMKSRRLLGHDLGEGDPRERLEEAGHSARVVGENVANAGRTELLHRALYESPSHQGNLLRPDFDAVGVAVVADERGELWGCELFAAGLR